MKIRPENPSSDKIPQMPINAYRQSIALSIQNVIREELFLQRLFYGKLFLN